MSRGAASGDLDNDGDVDIVVSDYAGPAHLQAVVDKPAIDRVLKIAEPAQESAHSPAALEQMRRGFALTREGRNTESVVAFQQAVKLNEHRTPADRRTSRRK